MPLGNLITERRNAAGGAVQATYTWAADGTKLKAQNHTSGFTTDYVGPYQYENGTLAFFFTAEGRCIKSGASYVYEYVIKDHLGNTRATFDVPTGTTARLTQATHYYPFGLEIGTLAYTLSPGAPNDYKYNGKELQVDFGLPYYDYGARMYDATLGRWHGVDKMAEKRTWMNPYNFVQNNPLNRLDPNGLTDFTLNKKTGVVTQVGDRNNEPDRIILTNGKGDIKYKKNGEPRIAVNGIEQGILKDGQNFKDKDQIISVGGKGQPSTEGVKSFAMKLQGYLGKEVAGYTYSSNGSGSPTDVVIGKYKNNTTTQSFVSLQALNQKYGNSFSYENVLQHFHTHPDGKLGATLSAPHLSADVRALQNSKPFLPNAQFIIVYQTQGQETYEEYDYTFNYRPNKKEE